MEKLHKEKFFKKKGSKLTKFGNESLKFTNLRPTHKKLGKKVLIEQDQGAKNMQGKVISKVEQQE
jgi:hypothetical protein